MSTTATPLPTAPTASTKPPKQNVRHDIAPELVLAQIEHKVAEHERFLASRLERGVEAMEQYRLAVAAGTAHRWTGRPPSIEGLQALTEEAVTHERTVYAKVRVIEMPVKGKRFVLAYGDCADAEVVSGTGPFESFDAAASWFLRGGR